MASKCRIPTIRMFPLILIAALALLVPLGPPLAAPPTYTVTLEFVGQALDLDTHTVFDAEDDLSSGEPSLGILFEDHPEADFTIAYHADRTVHSVIFQNSGQGVEIAFLDNTPFESVEDVSGLTFTSDVIDEPFGFEDTVVLKTDTGDHFKLGHPVVDLDNWTVTLDYEQVGQSSARNSVDEGETGTALVGSQRVAQRIGAAGGIARVYGRAVGQQSVGLGGATVVGQSKGVKPRVNVNLITGGGGEVTPIA